MVTVPLPARNTCPVPRCASEREVQRIKIAEEVERSLMNHFRTHLCAICGEERSANQPRFLVAENTWEDKLTILQWNEQMASRAGIQVACGIDHVEELVIHLDDDGKS